MPETIDGLPIPKQWLNGLLKSLFNAEPTTISAKAIDEGKGFLSLIAQLKFSWPDSPTNSLPKSLILKVPNRAKMEAGLGTAFAENDVVEFPYAAMLELVHNSECSLYRMFSLELPSGQKSPVTLGKIYAVESEMRHTTPMRYILMEDFVGKGKTPDFVTETLTEGQVREVIKEIASLQAYGLSHPDWNADGKFQSFDPEQWKSLPEAIKGMRVGLRAQYGDVLTATDSEIDSVCDFTEALKVYSAYTDGKKQGVMAHGDLWSNNIIFEVDAKTGRTTDKLLALIDWQVVHVSSPTEDIARLLSSSVAAELRRQHTNEWLEMYYDELKAKLPNGFVPPFTFEEVMGNWKKSFEFGAAGFLMHVAIVINTPKACEHCTEEDKRNLVMRIQKNIEDCL